MTDRPAPQPLKAVRPPRPARPPATLRRVLITPEGVDLGVELATLSARLGALIIDLVILFITLILLIWALGATLNGWTIKLAPQVVLSIFLLTFFFLRNAWFAIWEMRPAGATPGKRLMKIRVAMRNGGRLTTDAVIARNVTREIELYQPAVMLLSGQLVFNGNPVRGWMVLAYLVWVGVFLLFPAFNRDKMRAGDLIAGTWVVNAPRETLQPDLARDSGAEKFAFTQAQLDAYGVMELQVLESVLRRMERTVVKDVATRIRLKIGWTETADETDAAFLTAYYTALRERLEKRLLFGHRRKDKFDRSGLS